MGYINTTHEKHPRTDNGRHTLAVYDNLWDFEKF